MLSDCVESQNSDDGPSADDVYPILLSHRVVFRFLNETRDELFVRARAHETRSTKIDY